MIYHYGEQDLKIITQLRHTDNALERGVIGDLELTCMIAFYGSILVCVITPSQPPYQNFQGK